MSALGPFYATFFLCALVRRGVPYAAIVYGFEVLGGHNWSGVFYFCLVTPYLLFSLPAGNAIDRRSAARVLRWAAVATLPPLLLLALAESVGAPAGAVQHGTLIAALLFGYGTAYAFAYPSFIAVIPSLAPPAAVGRATIWINVTAIASLAYAPLVVGALREFLPWRWLFATFAALAVLAAGATLRIRGRPANPPARDPREPPPAGLLAFCRASPLLTGLLLAAVIFSAFVVGPLEVLLPHFAEHTLRLSPLRAGAFVAVGGTGLVLGSIAALPLAGRSRLGTWLCGLGVTGAACMVAMTFAPPALAFVLVFVGGVLGGLFSSLSIAGTQAVASDALRGRVMGLFALIFGGVPGIGGFAAGALASAEGTVTAIRLFFAAAGVAFAALFALRRSLRS